MKAIHVNTGISLAQPYESDYAMIRRCLVANPGMSLSFIELSLKQIYPNTERFNMRLHNLQPSARYIQSVDDIRFSYKRQCPKCAALLYHTGIYSLEWLTHCPIHHVSLTRICPGCNQPWPDRYEVGKRACSTCGRISLKLLIERVLPGIQSLDYTPIKMIYDFMQYQGNHQHIRLDCYNPRAPYYNFVSPWWRLVEMNHVLYPGFQFQRQEQFTKSDLDPLHISYSSLQTRSSSIYPYRLRNFSNASPRQYETLHLTWIFQVMKQIVRWIAQHSTKNHTVHISEYYYLDLQLAINKPDICPFCTALSIWLFDVLGPYLDPNYLDRRRRYKFLSESGFNEFYRRDEPFLAVHNDRSYILSKEFSRWFYQRGLLVSFIDIQRAIFSLVDKIRQSRKKHTSQLYIDHRIEREKFTDQYCAYDLVKGRFAFYYVNEQPLDAYTPPVSTDIEAACETYHNCYSEHYSDSDAYFLFKLPSHTLSRETFEDIKKQYRDFMESL